MGESKAAEARMGVYLKIGVEVMLLLKGLLETSAKTLEDLHRSGRGLLTDRFSGEPLPGTERSPVSAKISKSVVKSLKIYVLSSRLKAGLQGGRFSSRQVMPGTGEPTISRTLSRCKRRFVFGETDGGGLAGAFNFRAGVRGGSICEESGF